MSALDAANALPAACSASGHVTSANRTHRVTPFSARRHVQVVLRAAITGRRSTPDCNLVSLRRLLNKQASPYSERCLTESAKKLSAFYLQRVDVYESLADPVQPKLSQTNLKGNPLWLSTEQNAT